MGSRWILQKAVEKITKFLIYLCSHLEQSSKHRILLRLAYKWQDEIRHKLLFTAKIRTIIPEELFKRFHRFWAVVDVGRHFQPPCHE